MRLLMTCLLIVLAGLATSAARAERRVALLIGNSQYAAAAQLPNPTNDIKVMEQSFRDGGFDVVEARGNLDRAAMVRALRDFEEKAAGADVGVVFFSGHGMELNGQNFLLPIDARLESDRDVEDETIGIDRFMRALDGVKGLKLVILDACRDNPFLTTMKRRSATRAVGRGLARVEPNATETLIAYASRAGTVASDGAGTNSPFTAALAKHLLKPGLDVRIALGSVRDDVLAATSGQQEPYFNGSIGAGVRALVPEAPVAPPPPPPPVVVKEVAPPPPAPAPSCFDAAAHWAQAKEFNQIAVYELHLKLYGACNYAEFARIKIEALKAEAARPAAPPPAPVPVPPKDLAILTPPPAIDPPPTPLPAGPSVEVIRAIQGELKRLGCAPDGVDGTWSKGDEEALKRFVRATRVALRTTDLGTDDIAILKRFSGRVCLPTCGKGEVLQGERCVPQYAREQERACPEGHRRNEYGRCVDADRAPPPDREEHRGGSRDLSGMNPNEMTKDEARRELDASGCTGKSVIDMQRGSSKRMNIYRCDALSRRAG